MCGHKLFATLDFASSRFICIRIFTRFARCSPSTRDRFPHIITYPVWLRLESRMRMRQVSDRKENGIVERKKKAAPTTTTTPHTKTISSQASALSLSVPLGKCNNILCASTCIYSIFAVGVAVVS